jgi:anhydro-N-acetylmuramic acid kinase
VNRFAAVAAKTERLVVGLMSGTSADGVDAALVRIAGAGPETRVTTVAAITEPYPAATRDAIHSLSSGTAPEIARWNADLGELFAAAALRVIERAGMRPADVDLIGSHGQTIVHLPRAEGRGAATLQIGEPCVIAERTGIPVVADFRPRDVAAGGEGAPLVPWVDWLLLRPSDGARLAQNLGGVGNVTVVTADPGEVLAFDTGPANAPIDAAARLATGGRLRCDEGGRLASAGRADESEVQRLLAHPYFEMPPPKSLDRDTFGAACVAELTGRRSDLSGEDLVATVTEFVARSVADAYSRHVPKGVRVADVVVSGGGVKNPALLERIRRLVAPWPVRSSAELGVDPDAKEAVAFAILANEAVAGRPANLPRVTGARRPVVLGKFVP